MVDLEGWSLSDDPDDPTRHVIPSSLLVEPGGFVLLYADGSPELGPAHLDFGLDADGEAVVLRDPWANTSVVAYGEVGADVAVARDTDCGEAWVFPFRGTPGASNLSEPLPPVEELVVPRNSDWAWRAALEAPEADWALPEFDDSSWERGPGPLGFGDAHIVTVLPTDEVIPTAYFRGRFEVDDPDRVVGLLGSTLRDDGAVVWLNGVEITRLSMPDGPIEHATPAAATISGAAEQAYVPWAAGPEALVPGENLLAVEVHQFSPESSDIGFDLELSLLVRP